MGKAPTTLQTVGRPISMEVDCFLVRHATATLEAQALWTCQMFMAVHGSPGPWEVPGVDTMEADHLEGQVDPRMVPEIPAVVASGMDMQLLLEDIPIKHLVPDKATD